MFETLEFARQVFETKVAPALEKWGYSVSLLPQRNPYKVEWKIGENGGLKIELFVSYRNLSDCPSFSPKGEIPHSPPYGAGQV
jgi:hypothetical protein